MGSGSFSDAAARFFRRDVNAALHLRLATPAAGPGILAIGNTAGAGHAADRGIAVGDERMRRQIVPGQVVGDILCAPIKEEQA